MTIENRDVLGFIDGEIVYGAFTQSIYKAGLGNGVHSSGSVANTKLKVTESGTPAMTVGVLPGTCLINGLSYTEASTATLTIGDGHVSNKRWDVIVYDQSASTAKVIAGTAAASPTMPDVDDDNDIYLGAVLVSTAEVTSIVDADIYDLRAYATFMESCSLKMSGGLTVSGNTTANTWVQDFDFNSMHSDGTARVLNSVPGIYGFTVSAQWSAASGILVTNVKNTTGTIATTSMGGTSTATVQTCSGIAKLVSGDYLYVLFEENDAGTETIAANPRTRFDVWYISPQ